MGRRGQREGLDGVPRWLPLGLFALGVGLSLAPRPLSAQVGHGSSALPQIVRVGVPLDGAPEVGIAGTAGYGFTEPVQGEAESHHRAFGSVAASVRPFELGTLWLRADGRYDVHPADSLGQDDGLLGTPSVGVRLGGRVAPAFALGGEVELQVPGGDAPSLVAEALTLEGRLLAALALPDDGLHVALMAGFRFDNTGATVPRPVDLRRGDRIALGVSDSHAILLGLGASYRVDLLELLAEVSWNALVGDAAPPLDVSPLRFDLGARFYVVPEVAIEVGAELVASARPSVDSGSPLAPIEPRVSAQVGLRVAIPLASAPAPEVEVETPPPPPEPAPPPAPTLVTLAGVVRDENGGPLAGATVTLARDWAEPVVATSGVDGAYALEGLTPGPATLTLSAEGYQPLERAVVVGEPAEAEVALVPALPSGQLRGMIRSFDGRPLEARVVVEDLGVEVSSDAEGFFELDVPPGPHTVVIEAPGHTSQRRQVEVPDDGVVVLNADLRRGRRGARAAPPSQAPPSQVPPTQAPPAEAPPAEAPVTTQ